MGTLREDQYTFLIISLSVLLRTRNVSDNSCREHQNTHFVFNNFCFENRAVYEITWEKLLTAGQATDDYGSCALHAGYLRLQIYTCSM